MEMFFTVLKTIFVLVAIIFLANFLLKLLNKQMKKNNKIINIVERAQIGNNSSLSIVEVCGEYYLLSSTDKNNEILKKLNKEEIEKIIEENNSIKENIEVNYKTIMDVLKRGKEVG